MPRLQVRPTTTTCFTDPRDVDDTIYFSITPETAQKTNTIEQSSM